MTQTVESKRLPGGQPGNQNARRHGRYARLTLRVSHPSKQKIDKRIQRFQNRLLATILDCRGDLTDTDAVVLDEACRCHRVLEEIDEAKRLSPNMATDTLLKLNGQALSAARQRSAAVRRLPLDSEQQRANIFDSLYRALPAPEGGDGNGGPEAVEGGERGVADATGDTEGKGTER